MAVIRRLQRNGRSVTVTLPAEIRDALDLSFGDSIAFFLGENGWVGFTKVDLQKRPDLKVFTPEGLPQIDYDK